MCNLRLTVKNDDEQHFNYRRPNQGISQKVQKYGLNTHFSNHPTYCILIFIIAEFKFQKHSKANIADFSESCICLLQRDPCGKVFPDTWWKRKKIKPSKSLCILKLLEQQFF